MKIFQPSELSQAATLLREGGLVAFPTETVYGLGASVFLPEAVENIFRAKRRPQDNPLIVHISDLKQLSLITSSITEGFHLLAEAFFPGPLTILLPKSDSVPSIVSANLPTIGVRMPAHPLALQLIDAVGVPLVAPSANLSGKPSSTTAQHVVEDFAGKIEGVLDGGPCHYGIESTVLMLTPTPLILRPGAISQQQLEHILRCNIPYAEEHVDKPLAPGMKYRHYAPRATVLPFHSQEAFEYHQHTFPNRHRMVLTSPQSTELYASFRQADAEDCEEILILCDAPTQSNVALMNRIKRASYSRCKEL